MEKSIKHTIGLLTSRIILYLILTLFGIIMIFPLFYMVIASLKTPRDYQANPHRLLPFTQEYGEFHGLRAGLFEFKVNGEEEIYVETITKENPVTTNKARVAYFSRPQNVDATLKNYRHVEARTGLVFDIVLTMPIGQLLDANGEDVDLRNIPDTFVLRDNGVQIERVITNQAKPETVIERTFAISLQPPDSTEGTSLVAYLETGKAGVLHENPIPMVAYVADSIAKGAEEIRLVKIGEQDLKDREGKNFTYPVYEVTYAGKTETLVMVFFNSVGMLVDQETQSTAIIADSALNKENRVESIEFQIKNYDKLLSLEKFDRALVNTFFVTILVVLGQLTTSVLGGYAFSRIQFKGRDAIFVFYLGSIMIPFVVLIVPMYRLMVEIGWQSRIVSLIVPWIFSAYGTFLMRQFFMSIPVEIEEAALLDGCSRFRILWQIFIPLSTPALATQAIFTFLYAWNSFLWPLFMFGDKPSDSRVLTLALISLANRASAGEPNLVFTGVAVTILPPVIVFILAQKYFVEGIATSGLKG